MTSLLPNSRRPDVTFHPNGRIDITARIAKMLHIKRGDVIDIATTGEEYLLYVRLRSEECNGRHEATAYPTNKGKRCSNNFRLYSSRLYRAIAKVVFGTNNGNTARLIAGSPIVFGPNGTGIPLITRNPL